MLYREIIAVCSQIHTKHLNTLCGQNVGVLNLMPSVHKSLDSEGFKCSLSIKSCFLLLQVRLDRCTEWCV